MTDEQKDKDDEASVGPRAGERLAEARRLRQISLPDIARELHLDEAKVQALEENRFDVLGAPVFAKGHLRKYADLVAVPIEDVLADYYTMNRATGAPPVVGKPREPVRDFSLSPWIFTIPVILLVAAIAWWWLGRVPAETEAEPSPPPAATGQTVLPGASAGRAAEQAQSGIASPDGNQAATDSSLAEAAVVTDNPPAPATTRATTTANDVSLTLNYSGDCWTEVTDASGERLFFDLGSSGREVSMSGAPPLRVLLGNSNNVTVMVNGEPYDIAASERRGDTARLTIDR